MTRIGRTIDRVSAGIDCHVVRMLATSRLSFVRSSFRLPSNLFAPTATAIAGFTLFWLVAICRPDNGMMEGSEMFPLNWLRLPVGGRDEETRDEVSKRTERRRIKVNALTYCSGLEEKARCWQLLELEPPCCPPAVQCYLEMKNPSKRRHRLPSCWRELGRQLRWSPASARRCKGCGDQRGS